MPVLDDRDAYSEILATYLERVGVEAPGGLVGEALGDEEDALWPPQVGIEAALATLGEFVAREFR